MREAQKKRSRSLQSENILLTGLLRLFYPFVCFSKRSTTVYLITFSSLPTLMKAAMARSKCSRS